MRRLLTIDGMSCGHCVMHVRSALEDVAGVQSPFSAYGKIGYKLDWFSAGATMLAVDYSRNEEIDQTGDVAESFAVVFNQRLDPLHAELYATARNYVLDREGEDYDDLFVFMSGVKLAF